MSSGEYTQGKVQCVKEKSDRPHLYILNVLDLGDSVGGVSPPHHAGVYHREGMGL